MPDFDLQRFVDAQERDYPRALAELRAGRKRSHWIWYVLPQLNGLGLSATSSKYGLSGLAEAAAYLAHPILGARLLECVDAMLAQPRTATEVLGTVDAMKLRSCLTLFREAAPNEGVFQAALDRFYGGAADERTLEMLRAAGRD